MNRLPATPGDRRTDGAPPKLDGDGHPVRGPARRRRSPITSGRSPIAVREEVGRVERLLSRFDPASEVSRVNREGLGRPVRIDVELFALLGDVLDWSSWTEGAFDVTATSGPGNGFRLERRSRTVRLLGPTPALDLGGLGKGYALDAAARILDAFGVRSALLDGGTSSILARGRRDDGGPWRVGIGGGPGAGGAGVDLAEESLSTSASFDTGRSRSDIIDPASGSSLDRREGCSVIAATGAEAEVLSTALLAMGRPRAVRFVREGNLPGRRVAWLDAGGTVEWLDPGVSHARR